MQRENQINGQTINFGVHLTLDGYGGNPQKLNDKELVYRCLKELPEKLGMHIIFGPEVVEFTDINPKDSGGHSGFTMIAESHISCHTFPYRKFVSIDAYTCKGEMDTDFVVEYFKEMFELEDVELNLIKRGTRFPDRDLVTREEMDAMKEKVAVLKERSL